MTFPNEQAGSMTDVWWDMTFGSKSQDSSIEGDGEAP